MAPTITPRQGNVFKGYSQPNFTSGIMKNPLAEYYTTNEQLLRSDSVVNMVINFLQSKLFSDGLQFVRNKELIVLPDDFETHVKHYWTPFLYKALRFIMARGYLIYSIYTNAKGVVIPDVPEFEMLSVQITAEKATGGVVILADWVDEETRGTPLFIFNTQSPFGVTAFSEVAPVDRVKPFLLQLYQLAENRAVASYHNSRPPMIVQHPQARALADSTRGGVDNIDDELERRHIETIHTMGMDTQFIQRIKSIGNASKQTFQERTQSLVPQPWWGKSNDRRRDRPETSLMYIPHGLQYVAAPQAVADADYLQMQTSLLENIYNEFGIPASAILNSSAKQLASGVEMHKTMLFNTLKMWSGVFNILMTDIYRIIYNVNAAPVAVDNYTQKGEAAKAMVEKHLAKFGEHTDDDEGGKVFDDSVLYENGDGTKSGNRFITVHLKSSFTTTPEQAYALYHEGHISWKTAQRLRLESVGLPPILADSSVAPPMRLMAQTMQEAIKLREEIARDKKKDQPSNAQ